MSFTMEILKKTDVIVDIKKSISYISVQMEIGIQCIGHP